MSMWTLTSRPERNVRASGTPPGLVAAVEPAAIAVDLGSAGTRIWAAGRPTVIVPTVSDSLTGPIRLVRRGRVVDRAGYEQMLTGLVRRFHRPLPVGAVVVACRPVHTGADDEHVTRQLLTSVFAPSRMLFIDTVRAAAIGAGAASGPLLVVDVGAELTEVAVLDGGAVVAARRADIGANDVIRPAEPDLIVHTIVELVEDLRRDPGCPDPATAARGGVLMVGGAAAGPPLAARTAGALGMAVRPAAKPRLAAVRGAGLAALAALRRAAMTAT